MDWRAEFMTELSSGIPRDEALQQELSTDFGRIYERNPAAVVRPNSALDVVSALRFARRHSLGVAVRGAGHSQNGQSLSDDLVLDTRGLDAVVRMDPERRHLVCQSGITWRALLRHLLPLQLSPPVLTNNLDVTVGGSLSTAGIGVASWKYGTQADHCLELEVVTGSGEAGRCSPSQNSELFNAARAGLGQFGVITEATIEVRRHKPRFRSFYLLYDELGALLDDLKLLMVENRFDYLESWTVPLPQGFTRSGGPPKPLAKWFFPLHATVEVDEPAKGPGSTDLLDALKFYRHVHTEEGEFNTFVTRLDPLFALWKQGGFWERAHPWMECILPWEAAGIYVSRVLDSIPPLLLQGGHILLWPARGSVSSAPLFVRPEGEYLLGFGILLAVPKQALDLVLPILDHASKAAMQAGGKRYLSGWLNFDASLWKAHYGSRWPEVTRLKARYDPQNVLNPGFYRTCPVDSPAIVEKASPPKHQGTNKP